MKLYKRKIFRILRYLKPYLSHEIEIIVCMIIGVFISLVDPLIIKVLIDRVLVNKLTHLLNVLVIGLIALLVFRGIFRVISNYLYSFVGQRILFDVRNQLFQHLERLHLSFYTSRKTGEILSRINNDVGALQRLSTTTFISLITDFFTVVGIMIIILYLNWRLTLISLAILPLFIGVIAFFSKRVRKQSKLVRERVADITSFFQEVFSGIKLVQTYVREDYEADRLERKGEEMIKTSLKLTLMGSISVALIGFIVALGPIIVLWYGGYSVIRGIMSLGAFVAFYAYIGRLFSPIYRLAQLNVEIQSALASVDRIFEFLDIEPEIKDRSEAVALTETKGEISFENVWFSYDSGEVVLKDVTFHVDSGQVVALVGPSGAGKTTITDLICRFYESQQGNIFIDDYSIKDLKIGSLRSLIGMVSQDPILFNTSIKENLRYANPNATDEEIISAAKQAYIHDFILSLPSKYDAIVGDRGVRLSGGQRQRIAIARAVLKNPQILIFDEATSSIDSESERLIQEALQPLMKNRTTLIIAHRFSTVLNADKIVVIDHGEIVGQGKHESLYAYCNLYKRLYDKHFAIQTEFDRKVSTSNFIAVSPS